MDIQEAKAGVLTISDKGSRGERQDQSGVIAAEILEQQEFIITNRKIIPDNLRQIKETLIEWV